MHFAQEIRRNCTIGYINSQALRHPWCVIQPINYFSSDMLRRWIRLEYLIPMDSRVEIDAKIAAGYYTSGKGINTEDLIKTVGRTWEETEH